MKATLSKDGHFRFSITIQHRCARPDLAHAIAEAIHDEANGGEPLPPWNRKRCAEALKAFMYYHGAWGAERASYNRELDAALAEAEAIIDRLFPELANEGRTV